MRIRVLGTRGEIRASAPRHSKHSGILVDGRLLLDLGEKEFLEEKPECVFITHLHPDHAFFINEPVDTAIKIYAPEEAGKITCPVQPLHPIQFEPYSVTPIPTHHSKKVKSVAYLVEDGRDKILYTGDIVWLNKEYHRLLTGTSLVITDGSYIRRGGLVIKDKEAGQLYGHNGIPDLIRLFKPFCQRILLVHFGSWFFRDISAARKRLEELGKEAGITVLAGYDGIELSSQ